MRSQIGHKNWHMKNSTITLFRRFLLQNFVNKQIDIANTVTLACRILFFLAQIKIKMLHNVTMQERKNARLFDC